MVLAAAGVATLALGAGATLAVRQLAEPGPAALTTSTREATDAVGDADLPVGDIVTSELSAGSDGTMTATVVVQEWTDPASDDWVFGETGARWHLDVDGDGVADGRVQLTVENGQLRAGVLGPNGRVRCIGQASTDAAARAYAVGFASTCIGNPESVRFLAQFAYDDVVFDLESLDVLPDWSAPLTNPAYVAPTTPTTPPTTPTTPPTTVSPGVAPGSSVVSLSPARLLDSRVGGSTVDGQFAGGGVRGAGSVTEVVVAGRGGVPGDASAVVVNVTVVEAAGGGFATVFPCGGAVPNASNLNYVAGQTVANAVVAKVGVGGKVCVFTFAAANVLVDVNGYIP